MRPLLVDSGPIVALLSDRDEHHGWAVEVFRALESPVLTCEPVITEAMHFLRRGRAPNVLDLIAREVVTLAFRVDAELLALQTLITRYASVPMSLADACLVRMTELEPSAAVLTIDKDFRVYRRSGRHAIPVVMPTGR